MRKNRRTDEKLSLRLGTLVPTQGFTQSLTRSLTSRVTRRPFDPLSLNPILAFDAEESMMAPLASESLDLDPANPSSLDVITATRAGTATYTDASGNIQTASPNTVRVDHVDGVPMILVEPAATNLVTYTDFSSGWGKLRIADTTGSGHMGQPSQILTATGGFARFTDTIQTSIGADYTLSFFIRRISGSGTVNFRTESSADGSSQAMPSITSEWQFVSISVLGRASTGNVAFGVELVTSGDQVEIAMPQVEQGTVATSYIPTSGSAVTRAADDLVIDGSDFTNFYNQSEGTVYAEAIWKDISTGGRQQAILYGDNNNMRFLYGYLGKLRAYDGTNIAESVNSASSNTLFRGVLSYNASNLSVCLDGGAVNTTAHSGNLSNATQFSIGRHSIGSSNENLNGHIKRLIYWPYHSDSL